MPFNEADEQEETESVVNVIHAHKWSKLVVTPHQKVK